MRDKQLYSLEFNLDVEWPKSLLEDVEALHCIGWPCEDEDGEQTLHLDGTSSYMSH